MVANLLFYVDIFWFGYFICNLNALAMEPLGHVAGLGAAVVESLTTFISLLLGAVIGQSYNGKVVPLIGGFAILSITAILVMY